MRRRTFLTLPASAAVAATTPSGEIPKYNTVSKYAPIKGQGMPGAYPGQVVVTQSARVINPETEAVDAPLVAEMMKRGMMEFTGDKNVIDSWRRFIEPKDVVGIIN